MYAFVYCLIVLVIISTVNKFLISILICFRLMPQPLSLMGAPRPGYRAVSNNLRMAGRGDFGEYFTIKVHSIHNYNPMRFSF